MRRGFRVRSAVAGATVVIAAASVLMSGPAAAAAATGTVAGRLTDIVSGHGVPDVVVTARTLDGTAVATTTTGKVGTYWLRDVPVGDYAICDDGSRLRDVDHPEGYFPTCFRGTVPRDSTTVTVVAGTTTGDLDWSIGAPVHVHGVVTDTAGNPAPGVVVTGRFSGFGVVATTTPDGSYRLTGPPRFGLSLEYDGSRARTATTSAGLLPGQWHDSAGGAPIAITPGEDLAADIALAPAASVAGRITDPARKPLAGVTMSVEFGNVPAVVTGVDGRYRIDGLTAGDQALIVDARSTHGDSPTGYASVCTARAPVSEDRGDLSCFRGPHRRPPPVGLIAGRVVVHDVALRAAAAVAGTVTDTDGRPLVGVRVTLTQVRPGPWPLPTPDQALSASDGTWQLAPVQSGTWTLCVAAVAPDPRNPDPAGYDPRCLDAPVTTRTSTVPVAPVVLTGRS